MSKKVTMELIQQTPPLQIAELEMVKNRFIQNYNLTHNSDQGDLVYHRQLIFFNQQIASKDSLAKCDKFSLYACFITAAVNGYSFDPEDDEVYLIPRDGKANLQRQAGAHVRRLMRTGQIKGADQAKLVYKGDVFEVEDGKVLKHIEKFQSDEIIAGYAALLLPDDTKKYFVYRKSDWEAWRKKSPNPKSVEKSGQYGPYVSESLWDNGDVNGIQPEPNFLRTKIIKHACKEKCWATGSTPPGVEIIPGIEVDEDQVIDVTHDEVPTGNNNTINIESEEPKQNGTAKKADTEDVMEF